MTHRRLRLFLCLLFCTLPIFATACKQTPTTAPLQESAQNPVEDIWFQDVLSFLGRIHAALEDPSMRVELRLRLLAGQESSALKDLGVTTEELFALLARMESRRDDLEARWPQLREYSGYGDTSDYPEGLLAMLSGDAWPSAPSYLAKPPLEYVCAGLELYDNLSQCVSWNAVAQAFCMYHAYLRYLQHLSLGCDG